MVRGIDAKAPCNAHTCLHIYSSSRSAGRGIFVVLHIEHKDVTTASLSSQMNVLTSGCTGARSPYLSQVSEQPETRP